MQYIKNDQQISLPEAFRLNDGSMQSGFDLLTDQERIDLAGVYPLVETQSIQPWQGKSLPVYVYTATECQVTYTLTDTPLDIYKQEKIAEVYQKTKNLMDAQCIGYSQAEIATWPAIQADVINYVNDNAVIGSALQQAADASAYTVPEIAALLQPRINMQVAAIESRSALVTAITNAIDHAAVYAIDIT